MTVGNSARKRTHILLVVGFVSAAVGVLAGVALAAAAQTQQTRYLVVEEFKIGPNMSFNEGIARLSGWVRALRASGKHGSVRLFRHDWGPEASLYIMSETENWASIGTILEDVSTAEPDILDRPFGFAGHRDNILVEIPVQ